MSDTSTDFDWKSDDLIAVREQPAIAVYTNGYGQVVLRRERSWDEEDDCFIPIAQENVLTVVRAILVAAGMEDAHLYEQRPGGGCYDIDWPEGPFTRREVAMMAARPDIDWGKAIEDASAAGLMDDRFDDDSPKDRTAAERQRRRRQKLRDMERDDDRDSVTVTPSTVTEEPSFRLIAAE